MRKVIIIIGIMVVASAYGADPTTRDITTSIKYLEHGLENRQDTIPAKSGVKAVTPSGTKGRIGERDIKTTLGDETTNQGDTGITTVATVKTAVENKQTKILNEPTTNVVTYTGTTDDPNGYVGRGVVTTTPIYDDTVNTYGNGLVRAATLNTAVQRGVSRALTQVNDGWRINDIGEVLPTTVYASASDGTVGHCYRRFTADSSTQSVCSASLSQDLKRGEWAGVVSYKTGIQYVGITGGCDTFGSNGASCGKEIRGISACTDQTFSGSAFGVMAPTNLNSTLQTAYENGQNGDTPTGEYCYCKVTDPHIGLEASTSPWIFRASFVYSASRCANACPEYCADSFRRMPKYRGALFGAVEIPAQQ